MPPLIAILGALLLGMQGAAAATPIDPAVTGLWVPVYNNTAQVATGEFDIFPDGTIVQRVYNVEGTPATETYLPITNDGPRPYLQWTINDTTLKADNVAPGTATFSNGKFTIKFSNGGNTGTYQLSANHRVMTLTMGDVQLALRIIADSSGKLLPQSEPKAATTSGPVDPHLVGVWLESIPMPDKGYTQDTVFEIHPSGVLIVHVQHVTAQQNLVIGGSDSDVSTDNYKLQGANGRYTATDQSDGSVLHASYVFSPGRKKMIVENDTDTYGFLFVHLADVGADNSISYTSGSKDLTAYHVMDPRLIGVWIGGIQETGYILYKMIEWHPNGDFVLHVRHVTGSQSPMDAKDVETYPGRGDTFGGRFLLAEPKGLRETGVYSFTQNDAVKGTELDLSWDTKKMQTDSYRVFGDFDPNGAIRPLPAAK